MLLHRFQFDGRWVDLRCTPAQANNETCFLVFCHSDAQGPLNRSQVLARVQSAILDDSIRSTQQLITRFQNLLLEGNVEPLLLLRPGQIAFADYQQDQDIAD